VFDIFSPLFADSVYIFPFVYLGSITGGDLRNDVVYKPMSINGSYAFVFNQISDLEFYVLDSANNENRVYIDGGMRSYPDQVLNLADLILDSSSFAHLEYIDVIIFRGINGNSTGYIQTVRVQVGSNYGNLLGLNDSIIGYADPRRHVAGQVEIVSPSYTLESKGQQSLFFDMSNNANDYGVRYIDGSTSAAESFGLYGGPIVEFDVPQPDFFIGFGGVSGLSMNTGYIPKKWMEYPAITIDVNQGDVMEISFPIGIKPVNDRTFVVDLIAANFLETGYEQWNKRFNVSLGDSFYRNVGTSENPEIEIVQYIIFNINAYDMDLHLKGVQVRGMSNSGLIKWFGNLVDIKLVSSSSAVVSKISELIAYYTVNPPEADDVKGNAQMQADLQAAALEDARQALQNATDSSKPISLVPGISGATIASSLGFAFDLLNMIINLLPWFAMIISVFIFALVIKMILSRR
jgi:hypothetical protein